MSASSAFFFFGSLPDNRFDQIWRQPASIRFVTDRMYAFERVQTSKTLVRSSHPPSF